MTCECGAHKTYKAPPKSTLHSDWCVDSPRFVQKRLVQKPLEFIKIDFHVGAPSLGGPPAPTIIHTCYQCSGIAKYGVAYPTNFMSGPPWAGSTRHYCGICISPATVMSLVSQGVVVTPV